MSIYVTGDGVERDDRVGRIMDDEADYLACQINNAFKLCLTDTDFNTVKRMITKSLARVKAAQ